MTDVRRFDLLEKVVADERRRLDDLASTVLARLGTHVHAAPVFSGKNTTALTVNTGFTPVTLGSEDFDSHGGHSTVSNTSRYTCEHVLTARRTRRRHHHLPVAATHV